MTANNIPIINANNTFQDWYEATALHANLLNTVVVTTDSQPTTGNAVIIGSFQSNTIYVTTALSGGTIGLEANLDITSNVTITGDLNTANVSFGGANNSLGLAANIHIIGANTTHWVPVANTTSNRLRFIPGATLESISSLGTTGSIIYTTDTNEWAESTITAAGRALLDDANNSVQRATLGVTIGTNVQAYDAGLQSISGLTTSADKLIYTTASDTYTTTTLTSFGRTLIDDANSSVARATLGVTIGTNVQAYDAGLQSISSLGTTGNRFLYTTNTNIYTESYISPQAIELLANNDVGGYIIAATGGGSMASQNSDSVAITGGSVTGITDIAIADGGTGSSTAAGARTNLGLVIGTNVQAYSSVLNGTTASFTTGLKSNYDTAYGWGNHASAGYLAASSYTAADVLSKVKSVDGSGSGLDADLLDGYGTSTTATADTVAVRNGSGDIYQRYSFATNFNMSVTQSTRNSDTKFVSSTNDYMYWNTAAGMRNSLGLDIGSDVQAYSSVLNGTTASFTTGLKSNYDTAYGWGNHASAGYLSASSYTAADVLNKVKTVDGPGSGLNADVLDGYNASESATASTVAVRNSSGYIFASYFNTNHGVTTRNSDTYFFTSTDDYIRKNSISGARASLGLGSLAYLNTISGSNWSGTDLAIGNGGTGSSTTSGARSNLDVYSKGEVDSALSSAGSLKAWVNFDGTSTVTIRNSLNVSSITDNASGDYTINFASALSNNGYAAVFGAGSQTGGQSRIVMEQHDSPTRTTTQLRIYTLQGTTPSDTKQTSIAIFI